MAVLPTGCAWSYGVVWEAREGVWAPCTGVVKSEIAISHRSDVQRMIVAVTLDTPRNEPLLWVFPLPVAASQSRVATLRSFPRFFGHDPCWGGRAWIHAFLLVSRATQLYPMLFEHIFLPDPVAKLPYYPNRFRGCRARAQASVVSAESRAALTSALAERGLHGSPATVSAFDPWLSRREPSAFVMATIEAGPHASEDAASSRHRRACVFVELPSSQAVLPMPPVAADAAGSHELVVYVMDYVRAQCSAKAASTFGSTYRYQSRFGPEVPSSFMEGLPREQAPVTVVRFTGPPAGLSHTLRFRPAPPPGLAYAELVESLSSHAALTLLAHALLILGFSHVAAGLTGLLLFRKWRGYARLGALNLLTIVGMAIAMSRLSSRYRAGRTPPFASPASRWQFLGLFSAVYVTLTILAGAVLLLPFGR